MIREGSTSKRDMVNQFTQHLQEDSQDLKLTGLSQTEVDALKNGLSRMKRLAQLALDSRLKILVDAEYTYMNDGISAVALALMCHFNRSPNGPVVGNTYQCYLKVNQ